MRLSALARSFIVATALLTGMGQPLSALAHGAAHAHEAEHRETVSENSEHGHVHDLERELAPDQHHHEHQHAMVDAGLKSRSQLSAFVAITVAILLPDIGIEVEQVVPQASDSSPPPERRFTSASPRAPPAR